MALGEHFGQAKTGSLVRHLAFWVLQDCYVAENMRTYPTCQLAMAKHCRPRVLHDSLQLPLRGGWMIGEDYIAGLPTAEAWLDMVQNNVDLL